MNDRWNFLLPLTVMLHIFQQINQNNYDNVSARELCAINSKFDVF